MHKEPRRPRVMGNCKWVNNVQQQRTKAEGTNAKEKGRWAKKTTGKGDYNQRRLWAKEVIDNGRTSFQQAQGCFFNFFVQRQRVKEEGKGKETRVGATVYHKGKGHDPSFFFT